VRNAVIVDAVRTPIGKRNGMLKDWHPVDLAAETLKALVERTGVDPALVEDVLMGCVSQVGEQGYNVGRNAVLAAGWPESVPGSTVDRQCGSSQQSAHFAAQGVMAGAYDIVVAAGVEAMTRVPLGSSVQSGPGAPFGPTMMERYENSLVPQGVSAELIAEKWGFSRQQLDEISLESHVRANRAAEEGRLDSQIIPIEIKTDEGAAMMTRDEGVRPDSSMEALAGLRTAFKEDGVVTAGNSSQISDGASALLIMGEDTAEAMGLTPKVRFKAFAIAGTDPILMLTGPIPATAKVLEKAGLGLDDIDLFEVNEAFASVVAAWLHETGVDSAKLNVNGGAIANGHPLGASGGKLMANLVHEMERSGARYGLQTMCEGGGMANATILERV
jgi:acetyl-CoA acyltransferase